MFTTALLLKAPESETAKISISIQCLSAAALGQQRVAAPRQTGLDRYAQVCVDSEACVKRRQPETRVSAA